MYKTTLIQYPSGRYGFVGNVPRRLPQAFDTIEQAINTIKFYGYDLPQDYAVQASLLEQVKALV